MKYKFTFGLFVRRVKNLPFIWFVYKMYTEVKLQHRFTSRSLNEENIFSSIFSNNLWNNSESKSGQGSTLKHTKVLIDTLPIFLRKHGVLSILDAPCGDFNWMKEVDLAQISYTGGDIVKELIDVNNEKFGNSNVKFIKLNIIKDNLPKADLILVRDCLVHFDYQSIRKFLDNLINSDIQYLLTTNFPLTKYNYDITMGNHRLLNFKIQPFGFPTEIDVLTEKSTEDYGQCPDKSLFLWRVADLKSLHE